MELGPTQWLDAMHAISLTSQLADEGPAFRVTIRLAVLPKPVLQGVAVKKSSNASKEMISAKLPGEVLQRAQTFWYLQSNAQTINGYGFSWKLDTPLYCCTGVLIWMLYAGLKKGKTCPPKNTRKSKASILAMLGTSNKHQHETLCKSECSTYAANHVM